MAHPFLETYSTFKKPAKAPRPTKKMWRMTFLLRKTVNREKIKKIKADGSQEWLIFYNQRRGQ